MKGYKEVLTSVVAINEHKFTFGIPTRELVGIPMHDGQKPGPATPVATQGFVPQIKTGAVRYKDLHDNLQAHVTNRYRARPSHCKTHVCCVWITHVCCASTACADVLLISPVIERGTVDTESQARSGTRGTSTKQLSQLKFEDIVCHTGAGMVAQRVPLLFMYGIQARVGGALVDIEADHRPLPQLEALATTAAVVYMQTSGGDRPSGTYYLVDPELLEAAESESGGQCAARGPPSPGTLASMYRVPSNQNPRVSPPPFLPQAQRAQAEFDRPEAANRHRQQEW